MHTKCYLCGLPVAKRFRYGWRSSRGVVFNLKRSILRTHQGKPYSHGSPSHYCAFSEKCFSDSPCCLLGVNWIFGSIALLQPLTEDSTKILAEQNHHRSFLRAEQIDTEMIYIHFGREEVGGSHNIPWNDNLLAHICACSLYIRVVVTKLSMRQKG